MARMRVELDEAKLQVLLRTPKGTVGRDGLRRAKSVQRAARRKVHSRTGRLSRSIDVTQGYKGRDLEYRVGTNLHYARFVHDGTGIYGPRHRPIRARAGHLLVFRASNGKRVYAKQVRGQRPNKFLLDSLPAATR